MAELLPIYTAENLKIACLPNWSLSMIWHDAPFSDDWLPALQQVTEADGVRILEQRFVTPIWQPVPHQHAPRVPAARDSSVGDKAAGNTLSETAGRRCFVGHRLMFAPTS
ncbi:MAG: hypothetical protein HZA46_06080 [Planctomycetales bacterium]|nr:hypothetical protein [Planctomycetales bacterium]